MYKIYACMRMHERVYAWHVPPCTDALVKLRKHTRSSMCVLCMYICMRVCKQRVHSHTANLSSKRSSTPLRRNF